MRHGVIEGEQDRLGTLVLLPLLMSGGLVMISDKQQRIFNFIRGYVQSNKTAPTIAEIGRHFQMRSPASVHAVLTVLKREGLIEIIPNISRGIRLIDRPVSAGVVLPETSELVM